MTSYTQTINTLSTIALDTMTTDMANLVNESGEKFLKHISSKGRIFVVNDAEKLKHPVLYGSGESTTYYDGADLTPATGDSNNNLGSDAQEHMKYAQFMLYAATRNINFPQAMPAGNLIPYVSNVMKVNMMDILNSEENIFVRGEETGTGTEVCHGAGNFTGENDTAGTSWNESYLPASLAGVVNPYQQVAVDAGAEAGTNNYAVFGGLDGGDHPHWNPTRFGSAGDSGKCDKLLEDVQKAILNASFSEMERPDLFMTTQGIYEVFLDLLRAKSQINDGVLANLGTTSQIPFAGSMIDWSRYLDADVVWDFDYTDTGGGGDDRSTQYPLIGINSNSLRLNVVAGGGVSETSLGFVQKVGGTQKHPLIPQVFDRVQYKRCWSVDGGRRSFVTVGGISDLATS
jgi:hypothetical protein